MGYTAWKRSVLKNGEEGDLVRGHMVNENMRRPFWELVCRRMNIKRKFQERGYK
jgi:hypothetical protein